MPVPDCTISTITEPSATDSFEHGKSVDVTWTINSMFYCMLWEVNSIKLYESGSYHSTLWSGSMNVTDLHKTVTLPSTNLTYGDIYTIKITYGVA
jgi:hypothetical protein